MNNTYTFTDRTSYLAAAAAWKQAYKEHSTDIRKLKLKLKIAQRANDGTMQAESRVFTAKQTASSMIGWRHEMKAEAQVQYAAEHSIPILN